MVVLPRRRLACVLCLTAVLSPASAPAQRTPADEATAPSTFSSAEDRLDTLRRASIFTPRAVARADIVKGPSAGAGQLPLPFNARVTCEFDRLGGDMGGNTPKFDCRLLRVESPAGGARVPARGRDESVKVKFRPDNREIYAEVAATRLYWALGFHADAMYPVRLECTNCPEDPMKGEGPRATRAFPEAVIERKFPGTAMEEAGKNDQGWSWKEFEQVAQPVHVKDGLKLLAAFVVHGDNKPEQQRLSCEAVRQDRRTQPPTVTCVKPSLLVQDLGATFGGGGRFTRPDSAKMNLEEWSGKQVWKRVGTGQPGGVVCQAQLPKSMAAKDGLDDPEISEDGRRFLAGLLCQLSDTQIADLFRVARVAEMPDYRNPDGSFKPGFDEADVVRQWVEAFKRKREEVAAGRCTWQAQPARLAAVDNPAGLRRVPNYCTARPH